MKLSALALSLAVGLLTPALAHAGLPKGALLVMDHGQCSSCAAYHLEIYEDGRAVLTPKAGHSQGAKTKKLSEADLNQIKFQVADLRESLPSGGSWKNSPVGNAGVMTFEYAYQGQPQTATVHLGDRSAPLILTSITEKIEKLAGVDSWLNAESSGRSKKHSMGGGYHPPGGAP